MGERAETAAALAARTEDFDGIVAAASDVATDDEHDPEGATIAFERAQVSALASQAGQRLEDLDRALQRLAEGSYGECGSCGLAIGEERLAARPAARTCIDCARSTRR